jgi:V/A-type H+-transporting ATPase subunit K
MVADAGLIALGAALAIGIVGTASVIAQGKVAVAGVGAITEDKTLFGKALVLAALEETTAIFGFVTSILIILFGFGVITI